MLGRGSHLGTWCFDLRDEPRGVPSLTGLGFHLCHTRGLRSSLHSGLWQCHLRDLAAEEKSL